MNIELWTHIEFEIFLNIVSAETAGFGVTGSSTGETITFIIKVQFR